MNTGDKFKSISGFEETKKRKRGKQVRVIVNIKGNQEEAREERGKQVTKSSKLEGIQKLDAKRRRQRDSKTNAKEMRRCRYLSRV